MVEEDYQRAVAFVRSVGKCSASFLQRRMQIGYNAAAQFVERMEAEGLVGKADSSGKRALVSNANDVAKVEHHDASNLAATVERARALLDDGDYNAALMLSSGAYDQAKAAAGYAKRLQAGDQLIAKARRMQADALLIESRAKIALANQFDEAQAAGFVATPGRPKKVSDENLFRLEDVGLSKAQVHEARKLRDAEADQPGLVQRAIDARIEAGLEPSRANLRAAIGTASAPREDRGDNFYQTPAVATRTLLAFESFSSTVWEPSCGLGAISKVLQEQGYDVILSDLVDRGTADNDGELQAVGDFLASGRDEGNSADIVTNPPYGEVLNDFVAHALRVHRPRKMALLLNLNFMCGFADEARNFVMDENPPARVYVFKRRLPMMHREGWDGKKASSRMNTAWFVWELQEDGTYGSATTVRRVDWAEFQDADAVEPGESTHVGDFYFNDEDFTRSTPRKTLDERVDEERARALVWAGEHDRFDAVEMRRGIGVRPTTADGLILSLHADGLIRADDEPGRWLVSDDGWRSLKAMASVVVGMKIMEAVDGGR
ncbi:DNA translocase FtsK [Rhizobium grahamii]|uniref:FtsK gamma domain-containing protein n=1 Tax=Rhizobium grahamii CCGE 502 TaxID=990285 RepID=S3HBX4_9HYPH|nr:DNA translocase FtsK [Rhizobium grahamii]EPE95730.1 hypothetical protein RGCCGE502_22810 [Rhizobium grahamii CCGE 502]